MATALETLNVRAAQDRWAQRQNALDTAFKFATAFFACCVLFLLGAVIVALVDRRDAGAQPLRLLVPDQRAVEPGDRGVRRAGADLRHARHIADRHGCRRADQLRHRDLPDRAVPALARSGRSAPRSSCWPAFPASSTASGACSCSRRSCSRRVQPLLDRHARHHAPASARCSAARRSASASSPRA